MTLKSPRPKRKHVRFPRKPKTSPYQRRHLEQIFEDEIRDTRLRHGASARRPRPPYPSAED